MEPENQQASEGQHQEQLQAKNRKFSLFLIPFFLLLLLLIGGTYLIYGKYHLPGEKSLDNNSSQQSPTSTLPPSSIAVLPKWHIPENYLATDSSGNIVQGSFKDYKEKVIAKNKGKILGNPQFKTLAKSGKYFLYVQLPDEMIAEFQKNPPYEFYGSNDYELHLVTFDGNKEIKDEIVDKKVSDMSDQSMFVFDKDEHGIFYYKYVGEKYKSFYYSFETSSAKEDPLPAYLKTGAVTSPAFSQYVLAEALPRDLSITSVNYTYNLNLYAIDGTKKKTLYANFISGENSLIFPTEKSVFLAREDYVDGSNSICYIEKVAIPSGSATPLRAQECPPGSSNTNYHELTPSPDGKLLLAAYSQDVPSEQIRLGNFFVYDLESNAAQTIAETNSWYGDYFWVNNREIIATLLSQGTPQEKATTYRVNLTTGDASPDETLSGKTILGVY